jgi:hypothetical protein
MPLILVKSSSLRLSMLSYQIFLNKDIPSGLTNHQMPIYTHSCSRSSDRLISAIPPFTPFVPGLISLSADLAGQPHPRPLHPRWRGWLGSHLPPSWSASWSAFILTSSSNLGAPSQLLPPPVCPLPPGIDRHLAPVCILCRPAPNLYLDVICPWGTCS